MKRIILAATAAFLVVGPACAEAHKMPHPKQELYWAHRCAKGSVAACTHRAALHWGASYGDLRQLSWCESRWDPRAQNASGASGLFQFMPRTWAGTPYGGYSVFSVKYNALAGAWGRTHGVTWSC